MEEVGTLPPQSHFFSGYHPHSLPQEEKQPVGGGIQSLPSQLQTGFPTSMRNNPEDDGSGEREGPVIWLRHFSMTLTPFSSATGSAGFSS